MTPPKVTAEMLVAVVEAAAWFRVGVIAERDPVLRPHVRRREIEMANELEALASVLASMVVRPAVFPASDGDPR